jgi:hypothetical protein
MPTIEVFVTMMHRCHGTARVVANRHRSGAFAFDRVTCVTRKITEPYIADELPEDLLAQHQ